MSFCPLTCDFSGWNWVANTVPIEDRRDQRRIIGRARCDRRGGVGDKRIGMAEVERPHALGRLEEPRRRTRWLDHAPAHVRHAGSARHRHPRRWTTSPGNQPSPRCSPNSSRRSARSSMPRQMPSMGRPRLPHGFD